MDQVPADAPEAGPSAESPVARRHRRPARSRWRVATPLVVLVSGGLFAVSAANSHGTDLRPGRYTDLASLVQSDADSYQRLREQVSALSDQVDALGRQVDDKQVAHRQRRVARLRGPAGLDPVSGAGVSVTLADAPRDVLEDAAARGLDLRPYTVHQQDIQAVVNAFWTAGATAVTVQGQRIVTTTGIKCTGNAVQLQGIPYPAPYTIQAVGDPVGLQGALATDRAVLAFRDDAASPDIAIGYDERVEADVRAPAYDGLLDISSARPLN